MYNEAQKLSFMQDYSSNRHTQKRVIYLLNSFEQIENMTNTDLSCLSCEQLCSVLDRLATSERRSVDTIRIIKKYVEWCGAHGLSFNKNIWKVQPDPTEAVKKQLVASPLHLQMIFNNMMDLEEMDSVDCVYRCFLWLAFAGLRMRDAVFITKANIDFMAHVIRYSGVSYEIYKEAIPALLKACELTQFNYYHPNYSPVLKQRATGESILRTFKPVAPETQLINLRGRITAHCKNTTHSLSYKRVYDSGNYYRLYERERAGIPVNLSEIVAREMEGKIYKKTLKRAAQEVERDVKLEYNMWKQVYG